jgi:hypothetical protein
MKVRGFFIWVCMTAATVAFFHGCQQDSTVPPQLIGMWTADDPKYEGRYLKFTDNFLIFGIGDGKEVSNYIEKIEAEQAGEGTSYNFHYRDSEGEKWTLNFIYDPGSGGTIKMKNRDEIWRMSDREET